MPDHALPPDAVPQTPQPADTIGGATIAALAEMVRNRAAARGHGPEHTLSLGLAATLLWARFLRFDPNDLSWPDRDRVVVAAHRLRPVIEGLEHFSGQAPPEAAPDEQMLRSVSDVSGSSVGQGLAMGVGMALAERTLTHWFGRSLIKHRTWVLAGESELSSGVALESAALAGHLQLDRLTLVVDIEAGSDAASGARTPLARFAASGWSVRRVQSHDLPGLTAAFNAAIRSRKPMLIACIRSRGGTRQPAATPDRAPLASETALWAITARRGGSARRSWALRVARHRHRDEFERIQSTARPALWHEDWRQSWLSVQNFLPSAPRHISGLQGISFGLGTLTELLPELLCLYASRALPIVRHASIASVIPCGTQDHGMAAMLNGIAAHGGLVAVGATAFVAVDRMRPALRLAAVQRRQVIHLLVDTRLSGADDGVSFQPVEQLAGLRAMPNMHVFRPASTLETMHCLELALAHRDGPSLIVLGETRPDPTDAAPLTMPDRGRSSGCVRGGYVVADATQGSEQAARDVTLIASGPEVGVALMARRKLEAAGIRTAVVSLPCWELFSGQSRAYRDQVLGSGPRIGIEAATGFGWERWLGHAGLFIGLDAFGEDTPSRDHRQPSVLSPDAIFVRVKEFLSRRDDDATKPV